MAIYEKLVALQNELKAPKGNYNSFGKYRYRSCEDILEAVKPLCKKYGLALVLSDGVVQCGDRIYIQATATLTDTEDNAQVRNFALARESAEKRGMDDSQITGTASSYARKYALNGLFLIDDTKDADTDQYQAQTTKIGAIKAKALWALLDEANVNVERLLKNYGVADLADLTEDQHREIVTAANKVIKK